MGENFSKASQSVYEVFLDLIEKTFPEVSGYSFGLLFRKKVKKSRGRIVLAEVALPSKLMSYFAKDSNGNPYDYLMIIDEMVWACAKEVDRIRIVRHELRHVHIDKKGNPKLVGHDFEDFFEEVKLNSDNPAWCSKLVEVAMAGYKQVKDGQKDPRDNPELAEDLKPVEKEPQKQMQIESAKVKKEKTEKKTGNTGAKLDKSGTLTKGLNGISTKVPDSHHEAGQINMDGVTKPAVSLDQLARDRGLKS